MRVTNVLTPKPLKLVHLMVLGKVVEAGGGHPGSVGERCGIHYQKASAWAWARLRKLEERKLIVRRSDSSSDNYFLPTQEGILMWNARKEELVAVGEWLPMRGTFRNLVEG